MARWGNQLQHHNTPLSGRTCMPRFVPCCLLYLHIIRNSKWSIGAMKYIQTWTDFLFLVQVWWMLFFLWKWPTSVNSSSAALSFWRSRLVLSAMYHFQSGIEDTRSLVLVPQQLIRRSHCSVPAPCLLLMLMDWAISQMCSLTLLPFHCVVKPPFSCQIPMVSATHWLTPTTVFLALERSSRVGVWIV